MVSRSIQGHSDRPSSCQHPSRICRNLDARNARRKNYHAGNAAATARTQSRSLTQPKANILRMPRALRDRDGGSVRAGWGEVGAGVEIRRFQASAERFAGVRGFAGSIRVLRRVGGLWGGLWGGLSRGLFR